MNEGFDYRERIPQGGAAWTVLGYLVHRHRHSGEAVWRERIEAGRVLLDGRPAAPDTPLQPGGVLVWRRPPWEEPAAPLCFALLHRDCDLLAVAKPAGLPTLPGGGFLQHTLLFLVRRRHPEASPIHRLDRGASGLVLFPRHPESGRALAEAWRAGGVRKFYRCLILGRPDRERFEITGRIGRGPHPRLGPIPTVRREGAPARTLVRVLESRDRTSLVEVEIPTGRSHQIRIHLAAAGYPLLGDAFYGPGARVGDEPAARIGDPGYLLHAHRLSFPHPSTGRRVELEALPPPPLRDSRGR